MTRMKREERGGELAKLNIQAVLIAADHLTRKDAGQLSCTLLLLQGHQKCMHRCGGAGRR